ncbi:hypothetical protein LB507_002922 [Fusarium sp. FIESC RH6]|nr:hypothetical protein LB507_002922 [Fusarium sp. FIESC RH6]
MRIVLVYKCRGEKRGFLEGKMHLIVEMATHHWFWSQLLPSLISIRTCVLKTGNSTSRYCHWITRQWRCIYDQWQLWSINSNQRPYL